MNCGRPPCVHSGLVRVSLRLQKYELVNSEVILLVFLQFVGSASQENNPKSFDGRRWYDAQDRRHFRPSKRRLRGRRYRQQDWQSGTKAINFLHLTDSFFDDLFWSLFKVLNGFVNGKMKKRLNSSRLLALKRCQFHSKSFVAFHTGWKTCKKRPLHKSLWCYQISFWSGKLICSLKKWVNEVPKQFPITNLQSNKTTVIWHYR